MTGEELIAQLLDASRQLARTARYTGLSFAVPTCPGWTVSDLVRHLVDQHAQAAHVVRGRTGDAHTQVDIAEAELLGQFAAGSDLLVKSLQSARESAAGHSATGGRQFWIRRMTHDTTMHALDLEVAADTGMLDVAAPVAADGIDELVMGFAPSQFSTDGVQQPCSITLMPLDVNRAWTVSVASAGVRGAAVATDRADLTVAGMASDLYRWAWNRGAHEAVSLTGNPRLADLWHANFTVAARSV